MVSCVETFPNHRVDELKNKTQKSSAASSRYKERLTLRQFGSVSQSCFVSEGGQLHLLCLLNLRTLLFCYHSLIGFDLDCSPLKIRLNKLPSYSSCLKHLMSSTRSSNELLIRVLRGRLINSLISKSSINCGQIV